MKLNKKFALVPIAAALVGFGSTASADSVSFSAASGTRAASVDFTVSGTDLIVELSNTSTYDVLIPTEVLTAVFFDISGASPASSLSAVLTAGSSVFFDSAPAGGVVGGEWAYGTGLSGAPGGATRGISSSGFGLFGGPTFPGAGLDAPVAVDGLNYGITSAGDNPGTGNAAVTGGFPLIQNSVTFHLGSLPSGYLLAGHISNVSFQYGTALTEPNLPVPEPETYAMLLAGLGLMGFVARRRRKAAA